MPAKRMPAKNSAEILEEFMRLASKEIDVVAKRVQFEPAAQATAVEILNGISAATKKSISDFPKSIQSLPKKDRDRLMSAFERSGAVASANLLIPLLRMGDATDPCFLLHESAKLATFCADLAEIWDWGDANIGAKTTATIWKSVAYGFDVAAQFCDQSASEKAEEALNLMEETVQQLEQKIDFIMDLPEGTPIPTVPRDTTPVSLTALEKMLEAEEEIIIRLEQKINYIMDLPEGAPMPETPPDTKPVSLTILEKMLEACKKFYKFEGSFRPSFEKDKQLIRIGPLSTAQLPTPPVPILVTGFIDLSGMQDNDVVTITTKVLEPTPSPQYIIWRVKTFTGRQASGLKHFQDFSDLLEVPGDGVELLIAQSASSHNFDNALLLTIPYQFLVETTVLPDFNVS